MSKSMWAFQYWKFDIEKGEYQNVTSLKVGDEEKTRTIFTQIKEEFGENLAEPEFVIDLLDEEDGLRDYIPLTKGQVLEIAKYLGHEII